MHLTFDQSLKAMAVASFKPVNTDEIHIWARKNLSLPRSYAQPGPFDACASSRYLIEPFKACKDMKTRVVVLNKAVQTGGTLVADIFTAWSVACRPGPIQFSQATDDMIKDSVNNRLYPLFQSCKPLKYILPSNDKEFTNSGIRFPHMTLYVNGEKENAFQAKSIQTAIMDEVHLWNRGKLPMAMTRTSAFDRKNTSKTLIISQPGEVEDDFSKVYHLGTCEEWCVPCTHCSTYFFPVWRKQRNDGSYYGLLWTTDESTKPSGSWDLPAVHKTVRYECEFCSGSMKFSDGLLDKWNKEGKYITTNPQSDIAIRSFRWNSLIKDNWHNLVTEFIQAKDLADKGIKENLIQFFQKRMTQEYDPNYYAFIGHIKTDVYNVKEPWVDEVVRFMTIDCQKTHFWINIRAWSGVGASKQLFFGKGMADDITRLMKEFSIQPNCVFVDVGNTEKQEETGIHLIYEFVDRMGFTGLRGDHWHSEEGWDWILKGQKVKLYYSQPQRIPNTKNNRWYYHFAPDTCRNILKELRDGGSHEFKCLDNGEYKRQMFAEKKMPVKDKFGQIKWRWKNVNNLPNHAWDCEVMQVVCAMLHPNVAIIPKVT